ncbi:uncharacterized protein LOC142597423 [Dermatophagoides farinae]|uniref:uncharacterized protein LOC142597423 n=1 Tax=Dermatophagoides farinae TaxID=6954 RepID=UPI003F61C5E2
MRNSLPNNSNSKRRYDQQHYHTRHRYHNHRENSRIINSTGNGNVGYGIPVLTKTIGEMMIMQQNRPLRSDNKQWNNDENIPIMYQDRDHLIHNNMNNNENNHTISIIDNYNNEKNGKYSIIKMKKPLNINNEADDNIQIMQKTQSVIQKIIPTMLKDKKFVTKTMKKNEKNFVNNKINLNSSNDDDDDGDDGDDDDDNRSINNENFLNRIPNKLNHSSNDIKILDPIISSGNNNHSNNEQIDFDEYRLKKWPIFMVEKPRKKFPIKTDSMINRFDIDQMSNTDYFNSNENNKDQIIIPFGTSYHHGNDDNDKVEQKQSKDCLVNQTLSNQILQKSENSNHDDEYGSDSMHEHHHHNGGNDNNDGNGNKIETFLNLKNISTNHWRPIVQISRPYSLYEHNQNESRQHSHQQYHDNHYINDNDQLDENYNQFVHNNSNDDDDVDNNNNNNNIVYDGNNLSLSNFNNNNDNFDDNVDHFNNIGNKKPTKEIMEEQYGHHHHHHQMNKNNNDDDDDDEKNDSRQQEQKKGQAIDGSGGNIDDYDDGGGDDDDDDKISSTRSKQRQKNDMNSIEQQQQQQEHGIKNETLSIKGYSTRDRGFGFIKAWAWDRGTNIISEERRLNENVHRKKYDEKKFNKNNNNKQQQH